VIWRVALLVWLALAPLAGAQTLPGSADAAFRDALDLWLDDDEETALPAFAALAGQGNQAARLLLGLIDKKPPMQGPWLALQSRKARIGLLRAPGGLSGVSWLRRIDDVPLASRLLQVLDSDADIEAVLRLAADHEAVALRAGLAALEARQVTGFSAFADDPRFPPEMRYLIWRDWQKDPARAGRVDIALSERAAGDPQRTLIAGPVAAADLREWLLQTPLAAPLTSLCQAECPADPGRCMAAGFAALGGYIQNNYMC